jgi:hypothetical protein
MASEYGKASIQASRAQEPSDFFYRHSAASLGVTDALINGGKGFLVLLLIEGGRIVEVYPNWT